MEKLREISFFEKLLEKPQNELVEKAIAEGRTAIGYNCYVAPEAFFFAGNVFPVWMRGPGVTDLTQADYCLSSVVCSYSKAILQAGLDGDYDFLGALVFAPSCDHVRRSGQHFKIQNVNASNEKFFVHILDTSHKVNDAGINWMIKDMKKVAEKLNESYNANINEDTLRESIKNINEFNELLQSIADMRKEEFPKITGSEFHIIYGATKVAPKDMLIEPLKRIKAEIEAREVEKNDNLRIMVIGSTFDNTEYIKLIEDQGAIVVADRYCFGSLPGMVEKIKEDGDPYENIVRYYMDTCQCPRMMEKAKDRVKYCADIAKEYSVDGMIFQVMQFCDLWGYEAITFLDAMKQKDIPIVKIMREYTLTGEGQIRTRIQAFLESIKTKKDKEELR